MKKIVKMVIVSYRSFEVFHDMLSEKIESFQDENLTVDIKYSFSGEIYSAIILGLRDEQ